MATDLESLRVTIKEMESEIRRDGRRETNAREEKQGEKEARVTYCSQKCISSEIYSMGKEEGLNYRLKYV